MIPEGPLNKMVPLTEDHGGGGGGGGGARGPPLAHGLMEMVSLALDKKHDYSVANEEIFKKVNGVLCLISADDITIIESIKTTSIEDVNTRVLEKIKNI